MVSSRGLKKILCLVGPTASGKSELALSLAKKLDGEIINADSRQFYKELNIGTAKLPKEEQGGIPHHLIDSTSLLAPWSVADFVKHASAILKEICERGRVPLIVGGTGMYLKALLFGLDPIPQVDSDLRRRLRTRAEQGGITSLHEELGKLDPESARRLSPKDPQRILRALEVILQTGKPIHEFWKRGKPKFSYLKVGLCFERKKLYEKINARVLQMIENGLKQEAEKLWEIYPENPVLGKTISYQEWKKYGFENDKTVIAEIQKNSRQFAKRQLTWLRHEEEIFWFDPSEKGIVDKIFQRFP